MQTQLFLQLIIIILLTALFCYIAIKIMQTIGMEKVRKTVYDGFVLAENQFNHGENAEKFNYVVELAKKAVPAPFNVFITESLLRKMVQLWFDLCKNLLDDGRNQNT